MALAAFFAAGRLPGRGPRVLSPARAAVRATRVVYVRPRATAPHRVHSSFISSPAARSALSRSLALSTMTATLLYTPNLALCKGGDDDKMWDVEEWAPVASTVGFGSASGFACGYIIKKLGKAAMGIGGVLFMTFQAANYYG